MPQIRRDNNINETIIFLLVSFILIVLGLACMYSASYPEAISFGLGPFYFIKRQVIFAFAALVFCVVLFFIPIKFIKFCVPLLLLLCLALMLLTIFTRFGQESLGAKRWLQIGPLPAFQPSELVKLSVILFLAYYLNPEEKKLTNEDFRVGINTDYEQKPELLEDDKIKISLRQFISIVVILAFALLILLQKDYSTMIVYLGVSLCLILLSGIKFSYVVLGFGFLAVGGVSVMLSESYRVKRIAAYLFPKLDPQGINYQVTISKKAISSGGLFGKGLGQGYYKNGILPEVQNDFILANIAEELGLVGVIFIFALLTVLSVIGFRASKKLEKKDKFLSFVSFGFSTMILWQALVNAAVVSGLFPPTGIPLPFFSQGGTNLFVVICETGFLFRIVYQANKKRPSL